MPISKLFGDTQEDCLGIEHREGSSDRDLRRSHDRPRPLQVAFQSGELSEHANLPARWSVTLDFDAICQDKFGFCFISGVPATPEGTEKLSERIGFIRETKCTCRFRSRVCG